MAGYLKQIESITRKLADAPSFLDGVQIIEQFEAGLADEDNTTHETLARQTVANLKLWLENVQVELTDANSRADDLQRMHQQMLQSNMSLRERSMNDELTGLYNRRFFERSLTYEIDRFKRYNHPFGIVIFDIDFFKKVNDTFGHTVGDVALCHVCDIAKNTVRTSDILARWGGEEFVVLLPETDLEGTTVTANRLRENVAKSPMKNHDITLNITISVGATATIPDYEGDGEDLIRVVDEALYKAKESGRDRVVTTPLKI